MILLALALFVLGAFVSSDGVMKDLRIETILGGILMMIGSIMIFI